MVTQSCFLYRRLTVLENLEIAARMHNRTPKQATEESRRMLSQFALLDKAFLYPVQLSGGQKQRVAIAQQMLCSEHFLLLDEPTSALDPLNKQLVCDLIATVAGSDDLNTIIMVTHDIPAAVSVADTVWLMGRDRAPNGESMGARIVETYDLIDRGVCWHPDIRHAPEYIEAVGEIQEKFRHL